MDSSIAVAQIKTYPLRAQVDSTPRSSLGDMRFRNGLLVRVEDTDGAYGWGEIWCNFPPFAPIARARLVDDVIAPLALGRAFDSPELMRLWLQSKLLRMAIHTGEAGAFAHCIAGLDVAVVDLVSRRSGVPAVSLFNNTWPARVPVYASTPNPDYLDAAVEDIVTAGHHAIKLKVGYDAERDVRDVERVRVRVGNDVDLMVDANQAWDPVSAVDAISRLSRYRIWFFEEPLLAIEASTVWADVAKRTGARLAAGENVPNDVAFRHFVETDGLQVVQPDIAKWGGLTGAVAVARHACEHRVTVCPHYMGTAVGLAASLHLLAGIGGPGRVELDANPNPLRTALTGLDLTVCDGTLALPTRPGLGIEPHPEALKQFALDRAA